MVKEDGSYGVKYKRCVRVDHSRSNCTANPNCHFGLGEYQKGLWSSTSDDPSRDEQQRRTTIVTTTKTTKTIMESGDPIDTLFYKSHDCIELMPVGLTNLGATCYLNSLLQCLFYNTTFKQAVYGWKPKIDLYQLDYSSQMKTLQNVFSFMEYSLKREYDPSPLTQALALNSVIQQDAQEFNKLLMTHLENIFALDACLDNQQLIQNLFCGTLSYKTMCCNCKVISERKSPYYEIEVNMKERNSVYDCLTGYLTPEDLREENQYYCQKCSSKQNAKRTIVLDRNHLPPILTVQLMRFVYDMKTWTKKKLKDAIVINHEIELEPLLEKEDNSTSSQKCCTHYTLVAVLNHVGLSANVGHYTAHIRHALPNEQGKPSWFSFDDDQVEWLDMEEHEKGSRNAYMLLYKRTDLMDNDTSVKKVEVPLDILQTVMESNQAFQTTLSNYKKEKHALEVHIEKRKSQYAELIENPIWKKVTSYWVPTTWLAAWVTGEKKKVKIEIDPSVPVEIVIDGDDEKLPLIVPPLFKERINMLSFLCPHDDMKKPIEKKHKRKSSNDMDNNNASSSSTMWRCGTFSPESVVHLKRISSAAFYAFVEECGLVGDVVLQHPDSSCDACTKDFKEKVQYQTLRKIEIAEQLKLLSSQPMEDDETTTEYLVSRKFLSSHKIILETEKKAQEGKIINYNSKRIADAYDFIEKGINEDMTCPHGGLVTRKLSVKSISAKLWEYLLHEKGHIVKQTILSDQERTPCPTCVDLEENEDEKTCMLREERDDVLSSRPLKQLFNRKCGGFPLQWETEETLYLVSRRWLNKWRLYLQDTEMQQPRALVNEVYTCICTTSTSSMIVIPARITFLLKGNPIACEDWTKHPLSKIGPDGELILASEWHALKEVYPGAKSVMLMTSKGRERSWSPQVCSKCTNKREEDRQNALSSFSGTLIDVLVLPFGHDPPSSNALTPVISQSTGTRTSTRKRKQSVASRKYEVIANSTDTVLLLKYRIMEQSDLPPVGQRAYFKGTLLDDSSILGNVGFCSTDTLYIQVDNSQGDGEDRMVVPVDSVAVEEGFRGSFLVS